MKPRAFPILLALTLALASGAGFVAFAVTQTGTPETAANQPSPALPALEAGGDLGEGEVLAGTRQGVVRISLKEGSSSVLLSSGEVRKILRPKSSGAGWFFLGAKGILHSDDLVSFDERNEGLPFKTYKRIVDGKKSFVREVMDLKDLETDPSGTRLITCTKDEVWYSPDLGTTWTDLGSPSGTTGLKCVALAPYPGTTELAAWASHPIKGLYVRKLAAKAGWVPVTQGLYFMPTMKSSDEIADMVWVPGTEGQSPSGSVASTGGAGTVPTPQTGSPAAGRFWASNSFQEKIFQSNLATPQFQIAWDDGKDFGVAESLAPLPDGSLRFVHEGAVMRLPAGGGTPSQDIEATDLVRQAGMAVGDDSLLALAWNEEAISTGLSELWLLQPDRSKDIRKEAAGKNAIYLQAGYVVNPASRQKNFDILAQRGLNAFVIDLKDDYGKLRFSPQDPFVKSLARISNPLDIEGLAAQAKAKGVWLVARIPVFKDDVMATVAGGKYAVWDAAHKQPWIGLKVVKDSPAPASGYNLQQPPIPGVPQPAPNPAGSASPGDQSAAQPVARLVPNGERWVDPYSEDVWTYNVAIANEVIARGFDEVQFDYIRFPTDGENLGDATYRWKDPGMDKESAITSFLAFARERISAPISIDIYGANGWYRSGARTGQDVETLARYVDVICPMFYPSHFEQGFLAQSPAIDRPWRIYRLGTLRNARIARDRVIIRPYVQAFYMGVSYDKAFYNPDYVAREVTGVIQGENLGMTFWNNVDRYDDIPFLTRSPEGATVVRSASAEAGAPYSQASKTSAAGSGPATTGSATTQGGSGAPAASQTAPAGQPAATSSQGEAPPPDDQTILN